eukprot:GHVR01023258.1.p1 GENE.GHVR01023258.1~~GHVR01023258.1.p1  ORF type:complete len:179 (+),score=29.14 GHVR01023258.1:119-655(+)
MCIYNNRNITQKIRTKENIIPETNTQNNKETIGGDTEQEEIHDTHNTNSYEKSRTQIKDNIKYYVLAKYSNGAIFPAQVLKRGVKQIRELSVLNDDLVFEKIIETKPNQITILEELKGTCPEQVFTPEVINKYTHTSYFQSIPQQQVQENQLLKTFLLYRIFHHQMIILLKIYRRQMR